jgi:hypothetical protein
VTGGVENKTHAKIKIYSHSHQYLQLKCQSLCSSQLPRAGREASGTEAPERSGLGICLMCYLWGIGRGLALA